MMTPNNERFHLGAPLWGVKKWVGTFFPDGTATRDYLAAYSRRLSTVEGNTTFYALPSVDTVARWCVEAAPGFRFCMKFPRRISHELRLRGAAAETAAWLERLRRLGDRAGPSFLQLPPDFGPAEQGALAEYLVGLPRELRYAVEVRHPSYFAPGPAEASLDKLLRDLGVARVLFDARGLHASRPANQATRDAQRRKPNLPVRFTRTASFVLVRYVANFEREANAGLLKEWADQVAAWLDAGDDVYFCIHHPDDALVPPLCRDFHALVAARAAIPPLPPWESEPRPPAQGSLF